MSRPICKYYYIYIKTPYFYSLISTNYFPIIGIDLVLIGAADLLRGLIDFHIFTGIYKIYESKNLNYKRIIIMIKFIKYVLVVF